jgi:hypothetical protein
LEAYFFPNTANEIYVVNMIRTCKETLDIAIFTLTNDKICNAILEAFSRKVNVRVIADDECCKMWGSDVLRIAAAVKNKFFFFSIFLLILKNIFYN